MRSTLRVSGPAMAVLALVLTVASVGYGWHRDELYFRMLPPAWGYVDQPPFTPWVVRSLAGLVDEPWAVRTAATLACVVAVPLLAGIARTLGGDEVAQRRAAWGGAFAGFPVLLGHVALTSTFDHPVTLGVVLAALLAVRSDPRWWVLAGLLAGLATYNRLLVPFVVLGIVVGLLALGPRRALWSPWVALGALVGAVTAWPNLVWQADHGWPQRAMGAALAENNATEVRLLLPVVLVVAVGPFLVRTVARGLRVAGRAPEARWLVVAAAGMVLFTAVSGAQPHYPVTMLCVLYAAGCVESPPSRPALLANAVTSAAIGLPVLPAAVLAHTPVPAMNQVAADQVGWPAYVAQVAEVVRAAGPDTVVVTSNYGEAGAVARFGPAYGIDEVWSGQNALGLLPPPPESARTAVVVGDAVDRVRRDFGTCEVGARLDNEVGVDNEEQGAPVSICRDRRRPWADLWPAYRHLD